MRGARNIMHLGVKELWGLVRDPLLLLTIILAFTVVPYASTTALTDTLHKAPLAVVDEDQSQLSRRIIGAFYPPTFLAPMMVTAAEVDRGMDAGRYTFSLQIPPNFQSDVLAGRSPAVLLNVDATRMSQAFVGAGHIQQVVTAEASEFIAGYRAPTILPVDLATRVRFNPELNPAWFAAIMQLMDQVTLLSIILTGAALIREREYGTVEHLLVMPVTPFEIMAAKMWSMGLVILVATALSLKFVVQGLLAVPIEGSIALFIAGAALHLFATTSMGIFLGTYARTMPQFGLLVILTIMPLQNLSGGQTPRESMPEFVQFIMEAAPTTHFVMLAQSILYRGAGLTVVWPQFIALFVIGCILFALSLLRFRKTLAALV